MKIFIFLIVSSLLFGNISSKITKTSKQINKTKKKYKATYSRVKQTKNKLKKAEKELANIKYQIRKLSKNKSSFNARFKKQDELLKKKKEQREFLKKNINNKQKAIIDNLLKDTSFVMIFGKKYSNDVNDFVNKDIFKRYITILNNDSKEKSHKLNVMLNELKKKRKNINNIENKIVSIKKEINKKKQLELSQKRTINSINKTKTSLNRDIKKIKNKEKSLRKVLSNLNILKSKKERKIQKNQRVRNDNKKVRQVHSSYTSVPIYKYRGKRTIAPLKKYKLLKKFGYFYNDVYKLKEFNEFIVLKSSYKSQKVRNVLGGKIVFANKTPTLDKTVIVKHNNGIHTIYANLSKITPNLKKGKYVKKGFAIGKVDDELIFEVTKNNKFINPDRFVLLKR